MSEPLKYKAELAVAGYLSTVSALSAFTFYKGQNPGEQAPPCIVVSSGAMTEAFPDAMPKKIRIDIEIVSPVDTDQDADSIAGEATDRAANWSAHRAAVQAVESALQNVTALQTYANKGNLSTRPVTGFYIYDIEEESQQSVYAGAERVMISQIGLALICEAQDN